VGTVPVSDTEHDCDLSRLFSSTTKSHAMVQPDALLRISSAFLQPHPINVLTGSRPRMYNASSRRIEVIFGKCRQRPASVSLAHVDRMHRLHHQATGLHSEVEFLFVVHWGSTTCFLVQGPTRCFTSSYRLSPLAY
jgi:hypothetical protein